MNVIERFFSHKNNRLFEHSGNLTINALQICLETAGSYIVWDPATWHVLNPIQGIDQTTTLDIMLQIADWFSQLCENQNSATAQPPIFLVMTDPVYFVPGVLWVDIPHAFRNVVAGVYVPGEFSRQNDVLEQAVRWCKNTGVVVVEMGCFVSPFDRQSLLDKLFANNQTNNVCLVESGQSFGYVHKSISPLSMQFWYENPGLPFMVHTSNMYQTPYSYLPYKSTPLPLVEKTLAFWQHSFVSCVGGILSQDNISNMLSQDNTSNMLSQDNISNTANMANRKPAVSRQSIEMIGLDTADTNLTEGHHAQITKHFAMASMGTGKPVLMAGPCMLESLELGMQVAEFIQPLAQAHRAFYVFKSSFDKANRTSAGGVRGPGLHQGLEWLETIKTRYQVPILTDIHSIDQVSVAAKVADILQIPAFLCTSKALLQACMQTGKWIQIKKGQWSSSVDLMRVGDWLDAHQYPWYTLTERGTLFGNQDLVVDTRQMHEWVTQGYTTVFDATHSLQLPSQNAGQSSGLRQYFMPLLKQALGIGVQGVFMEVHTNPDKALSDKATQIDFNMFEQAIQLL
jgi:2-dehydro-3-deoxyphosphooctonate aldolase (KDO 8-P synthase)